MSNTAGRFVWHELNTLAIDAAIAFYGPVFGWTFEGATTGEHAYPHIRGSQKELGGITWLAEQAKAVGVPPHWMGYIETADVDATVAQALMLGGQVYVPPMDIPNTGRFSVIGDPQGAAVAVFRASKLAPLNNPRLPGEFNWNELATSDPAAAFDFYHALFGWEKKVEMDMGPMGTYIVFGLADLQMGGIFRRPAEMPVSAWLYYVMVSDVDATLKRAVDAGAKLLDGPMEVPGGGRIVQMQDAQGAMFAFVG